MSKRRKAGNLGVLLSMTAVLFLCGSLVILSASARKVIRNIEENVVVTAYFSRNSPEHQIKKTFDLIDGSKYFDKAELISPTKAAELFYGELGEDFIKKLGENPLPFSARCFVSDNVSVQSILNDVIPFLESQSYVYEVEFQENASTQLRQNRNSTTLILIGLTIIFLVIAILLIYNTIRLRIYSDRFKVKSMQLVGATEWFIQKPYIIRSVIVSLISAGLASIVVIGLTKFSVTKLSKMSVLNIPKEFVDIRIYSLLFVTLLIVGLLVAIGSTYAASRKYLRSKIDELY